MSSFGASLKHQALYFPRKCWPNWEDSSVSITSGGLIQVSGPMLIGYRKY